VRIGQDHYLGESRLGARVFFCSGEQISRQRRPPRVTTRLPRREAGTIGRPLVVSELFLGDTLAEAASNSSNGDEQIRIETVLN
jgi:hypothetical protein